MQLNLNLDCLVSADALLKREWDARVRLQDSTKNAEMVVDIFAERTTPRSEKILLERWTFTYLHQ